MLHPEKVNAALAAKKKHFMGAHQAASAELVAFDAALTNILDLDLETASARLAPIERPGARPTEEFDRFKSMTVPFANRWSSHEQARNWARGILEGVPTFAVDGSQVTPTKDLSIPVGLVQIGWFENAHVAGGEYIKDVAVEVLSPIELFTDDLSLDEPGSSRVNLRRFEMEAERLAKYMRDSVSRIPRPMALFDGTLIISFAGLMQPKLQKEYTSAITRLLDASNKSGVPLIGFVDSSSAHDLLDMIGHLSDTQRVGQITDADLLQDKMQWGDRSQVFICARDDNLLDQDYYESVCFCYLKTTAELPPARVEFPLWLFESGKYENALDLLRAECIVGTGYPYALETADAVAVIDLQDRNRFYRLVQRFTNDAGLALRFTRKSTSKRGRR
ncbi:MAG: DNA double-strand break repair nuclease NurA [Anaerolineales bacterium]|jgi:hypothetical protein